MTILQRKIRILAIIWIILFGYYVIRFVTSSIIILFGHPFQTLINEVYNGPLKEPLIKEGSIPKNQVEAEKVLKLEFLKKNIKDSINIFLGLAAGLLLLRLKKSSRIFAIVIASLLLISSSYFYLSHFILRGSKFLSNLIRIWLLYLKDFPSFNSINFIINYLVDIFDLALLIFTIIYLTRPKVKEQFK
jgi:hypothetical protein